MMDMLFFLKKLLSELMNPLALGLLITLYGLIALYVGRISTAKKVLPFAFLWIALFSYGPVSDVLLKPLESQYKALLKTPQDVKYVLVLGNGHKSDAALPITTQLDTVAVIRLNEGIRHHKNLKDSKLVLSGYKGLFDPIPHAVMQQKLAMALGVNSKDIIMFMKARDTEDEAVAMKNLVGEKPFILVTTASHMPRAYKIFTSLGLHPIAAPTDFHVRGKSEWLHMPRGDALSGSDIAFHEYYGTIWNWLKSW